MIQAAAPRTAAPLTNLTGGIMPGNLRAASEFDHILEKGTTIERRIVNATAMMEVACFDRLYDAPESESAELRTVLHEAADRALEGWIAAFVVALERFEAEHPDLKLKVAPSGR
jgi:hypothetical protein